MCICSRPSCRRMWNLCRVYPLACQPSVMASSSSLDGSSLAARTLRTSGNVARCLLKSKEDENKSWSWPRMLKTHQQPPVLVCNPQLSVPECILRDAYDVRWEIEQLASVLFSQGRRDPVLWIRNHDPLRLFARVVAVCLGDFSSVEPAAVSPMLRKLASSGCPNPCWIHWLSSITPVRLKNRHQSVTSFIHLDEEQVWNHQQTFHQSLELPDIGFVFWCNNRPNLLSFHLLESAIFGIVSIRLANSNFRCFRH